MMANPVWLFVECHDVAPEFYFSEAWPINVPVCCYRDFTGQISDGEIYSGVELTS